MGPPHPQPPGYEVERHDWLVQQPPHQEQVTATPDGTIDYLNIEVEANVKGNGDCIQHMYGQELSGEAIE
ncbi:UNVERIFIED_CONTAM: hypothetical protein Sradi_0788100 [Sesamum radiatum]|uniref:Uncharacterized protein n=1 Tax=Sesamum radiatum TaxID=300843 RepID=A0AAW2VUT5_SESRA